MRNFYTNSGKSNYHSLQVQSTLRPIAGLEFSRNVCVVAGFGGFSHRFYESQPTRDKDYILAANHVTHDFRSNGTFELPFGPNKLCSATRSGWVARAIEGWQTSFIVNLSTGQPASVAAGNMLYANGVPDVVGPFSAKRLGRVQWNGDFGNYFGNGSAPGSSASFAQVRRSSMQPPRRIPTAVLHAAGGYGCQVRTDCSAESFARAPGNSWPANNGTARSLGL